MSPVEALRQIRSLRDNERKTMATSTRKIIRDILLRAMTIGLGLMMPAWPLAAEVVANTATPVELQLVTGHNALISTTTDYRKVSVGDPEIADGKCYQAPFNSRARQKRPVL